MASYISIDKECCGGCGTCSEICPNVFKLDEETEKAHLIKPEGNDEKYIEEAIASCPEECIKWKN